MLRAAVVGVGYLGNFHAQKYKSLSEDLRNDIQFVGVLDANPEQSAKVAGALGVRSFKQLSELFGQVDLVTVATTTPYHYEIAKTLLENNIHVNVEKPISLRCSEARELVTLAKRKGLQLAVGHSERFNPGFVLLKQKLHRPEYIEFHRHAPFKARGAEVSVIHDLMIHDLDLMLSLDHTRYRVVAAQGGKIVMDTHDWASAVFEFESGLKCIISVSRVAPSMTRVVKSFQSSGVLTANLQTGDLEITSKVSGSEPAVASEVVNAGKGDNLLAETLAFLHSVSGKAPPVVTGEHGLKALEAAEAVIGAIESNRSGHDAFA